MSSSRPVPPGHAHLHSALSRKKRPGSPDIRTGAAADEQAFISSSRDASEEDNDEASGYSDSAASLRRDVARTGVAAATAGSSRNTGTTSAAASDKHGRDRGVKSFSKLPQTHAPQDPLGPKVKSGPRSEDTAGAGEHGTPTLLDEPSAAGPHATVGAATGAGHGETARHAEPAQDAATPYDGDIEFAADRPNGAPVMNGPRTLVESATFAPSSSAQQHLPAMLAKSRTWGAAPDLSPEEVKRAESQLRVASVQEIRTYFRDAILGSDGKGRSYNILPPPDEGRNPSRPIRIYADGVYDLFHYAHALQLRQAKLAFPEVYLIVGVCSSANCYKHKNEPVLTSAERYEAVKNCRWVDEVLEDAPWVIDQKLIDELQIDYVAHDEDPYAASAAHPEAVDDIYGWLKQQGKFLPTQRTPGVSTSELLARIVSMYHAHLLDTKLSAVSSGLVST